MALASSYQLHCQHNLLLQRPCLSDLKINLDLGADSLTFPFLGNAEFEKMVPRVPGLGSEALFW